MRSDAASLHTPVLLDRCVSLLGVGIAAQESDERSTPFIIDGTLGMGGHSEGVLQSFPHAYVIGIDRDPQAIELAGERLARFGPRFQAVHGTYDQLAKIAQQYAQGPVAGILLDLGVSSLQLDDDQRGFSYARDTYLDMRMDQSRGQSAAELLSSTSKADLVKILRRYGEERFAPRIAQAIVDFRAVQTLETSSQLVTLIREAIPAPARRKGGNPAKRTFQALRIAVNDELQILERTIPAALETVAPGGVVVVESYQSLEDKIVKRQFRQATHVNVPSGIPLRNDEMVAPYQLLTNGAEQADENETVQNPRAASVRLRAAQKRETKTSGTSGSNRPANRQGIVNPAAKPDSKTAALTASTQEGDGYV